jgi:hypothetical protein
MCSEGVERTVSIEAAQHLVLSVLDGRLVPITV